MSRFCLILLFLSGGSYRVYLYKRVCQIVLRFCGVSNVATLYCLYTFIRDMYNKNEEIFATLVSKCWTDPV